MKINLGNPVQKKSFFPINLDSSGTTNFGEVIPTFCQEVAPDTNASINIRSGVRFMPLGKPTFGEAYYRHYVYYMKISDLFPAFDYLLAKKPYASASGKSYIPTAVPNVSLNFLWHLIYRHSDVTVYNTSGFAISPRGSLSDMSFKATLNTAATVGSVAAAMSSYQIDTPTDSSSILSKLPSTLRVSTGDDRVTFDGADHILRDSSATPLLYCFRLNNVGKFLRKIVLGLGFKLNPVTSKAVDILPLFGFYKAYFDTFAPQRFVTWKDTYCYKCLHTLADTGQGVQALLVSNSVFVTNFTRFISDELLNVFYTEDTNYISSCITGTAIDGDVQVPTYIGASSINTQENLVPLSSNSVGGIDQVKLNVLKKLTQFVNRRTVVGGKISDFIQSVFGYTPPNDEVYFVGSDSLKVQFSDVMNLSAQGEAALGEFAGQAVGKSYGDKFNVHCKSHGFIICLSTVIPRTQFTNGVNPNLWHTSEYDFYNGMFDSVTMAAVPTATVYSPESICPSAFGLSLSANFGNLPNYTEYKTKANGILNGDLSLRSTRAYFDGFTLDRVINDCQSQSTLNSDSSLQVTLTTVDADQFVNGTHWRYIGRYQWMGRFDRIFQNMRSHSDDDFEIDIVSDAGVGSDDDNIIVHNVVEIKLNSPMVPIADSYMTHDEGENYGVRTDHQ